MSEARQAENETWLAEIHARYTYRMHDLRDVIKSLLQGFNPVVQPPHASANRDALEKCSKGVIVESGAALRTTAAHFD